MYKKLYSALKDLIYKDRKNFFILCFILLIETFVLIFSVAAIIPLADFILDDELKNPSKFTKILINFLETINLIPSFFIFGSIFVFFIILKGILLVLINYFVLRFKYSLVKNIADDTLNSIMLSNWEFFSQTNQGKLINTFTKEIQKIGDTIGSLAKSFSQLIQLIIYLSIPFLLNTKIAIIIFLIIIFFSVPLVKILNPISYKFGKENTETANRMFGVFSEILQAAKIIIGYGKKDHFRKKYIDSFENHMKATIKNQMLAISLNSFFQPFGILIVIIIIGISLGLKSNLSELAAIFYSFISSIALLNNLMGLNVVINNFLPSYEQLNEIKFTSKQYKRKTGDIKFEKIKNSIKFENVSFHYKNRDSVLKNINLEILQNKFYAFVGESGAGKSTLTDLVLGLISPTSGTIFIDNLDFQNYEVTSFRDKISYVPQENFLFNTSIKDNITWISKYKFSNEEIDEALNISYCKDFIDNLPDKINTEVGDRGIKLSGGQKQRIALARAFLKKPNLLVLDEATSSLDSISEKTIQKSLNEYRKKFNPIVIAVAHRLSTIRDADKIFVLKNGQIIEEGNFEELSKLKNGELKKMIDNQSFILN